MRYPIVCTGTFLSRPNRFIAYVEREGETLTCHVKNTGRCRELLVPGATVILEDDPDFARKGRKTRYSLIGVWKERPGLSPLLINMDSQAPNKAAWEWLNSGGLREYGTVSSPRREVTWQNSRFDLAFLLDGQPAFMEVKGVTLEEKGRAMFPDAPTERGVRHLKELSLAAGQGFCCFVLFVIQMKEISAFSPNRQTHAAFADALSAASEAGVHVLARDCIISPSSMEIHLPVPVVLD